MCSLQSPWIPSRLLFRRSIYTNTGTNTALAGFQITLPFTDRNQGNRVAANAEVHRREHLLAQAESDVKADYFSALQEYDLLTPRSGRKLTAAP